MKVSALRSAALALLPAVFLSCAPLSLRENDSRLTLSLTVPARSASAASESRSVPTTIDALYVQLIEAGAVVFNTQQAVSYGTTVTLEAEVPPGTFTVHVFALSGNCITGIAMQEAVVMEPGKTTSLSLTMSALTFAGATTQSALGYANPSARSLSKSVSGIPDAFSSYLLSGTATLYYKRNAVPTAWNDGTSLATATATYAENQMTSTASLPAATASSMDTLYYWFAVQWPGCSAVLTNVLPAAASTLVFDGATLAGNVTGYSSATDPPGDYPEASATVELQQSSVTVQNTLTDVAGDYLFGDVAAGLYDILITGNNFSLYPYYVEPNANVSLNSGSMTPSATTTYNSGVNYTISYTGLTVASGTSVTLDFHFTGY